MTLMQLYEAAFTWGFTLTVRGLPIYVSAWTILLALVLFTSGKRYIENQLVHLHWKLTRTGGSLILGGVFGALFMILSVAAHEVAHALAARAFGIHITGAGITGWGAYVSLPDEGVGVMANIVISLAGPLTNLLLAVACYQVVRLMPESVAENTIQYVAFMNWRLGKLNLLPVAMLDGGHAFLGLCRLIFGNGDVSVIITLVVSVGVLFFLSSKRQREKRRGQYEEPRDAFERKLEMV